ncbi:MAG: S9 family peptidase [Gemmatimonadales bacterium]|nr:MAG: S9 family peptidase [Gemmatimonadales bacterium]
MLKRLILILFVGWILSPGQLPAQDAAKYTVSLLGRTINLEPYFQGFPYSGWDADFEAGRLFYFHTTPEGNFLMVQPLMVGRGSGQVNPEAGRRLHEIDWSTRNFWGARYDSLSGNMILLGDEKNDEVINLYRMSLADGSLERLTWVPYIYGWGFSKGKKTIGYIARYGTTEPYRNCLTLLDPASGLNREVLCEEGAEYRMVWTSVNFRPDGSGVVLKLNRNGHRKQGNLAYLDLTASEPKLEMLLPDGIERYSLGSYEKGWLDNDRFYYVSDETGFANLYVYDLTARSSRQVTTVAEQAWHMLLDVTGRKFILQTLDRPHENVMQVIDPETGKVLGQKTFDANIGVIGFDDKNHLIVSAASAASPFRAEEMWIAIEKGKPVWTLEPKIRLPEPIARAIEQGNVERSEYPTFEIDPKTGAQRRLHSYLMTPKQPRSNPAERLAVITSFYGGGNSYSTRQNIYCEAGISWLSPAVRGNSGFGKEFMALNDRDLGGDEIVDLFYGARFLERKLGLAPNQIGVAGGSHGGYATMRALTFPPETNGRGESYPFGFGLSHAGFSSIVTFYDATNIPDWIILEAGDPKTERDKLLDRSPLAHVDLLQAPLLLTHGSNDNRVGVSESRQFNDKAGEQGKPVTYVEFEGQGHGIKGLENLMEYYQVQFDFLRGVICGAQGEKVEGCGRER